MRKTWDLSNIPVFLVLVLCFGHSALAATPSKDRSCLDCHKKLIARAAIHPVIAQYARMDQGCPSCHEEPHGKNKSKKSLIAVVPDLCLQCHDKAKMDRKTVHPPVAAGDCLGCHDPHASDTQSLLLQPLPYLCQNCHPGMQDGKHVLRGLGLGDNHPIQGRKDPSRSRRELTCVSCHDPHSSDQPNLFTSASPDEKSLCRKCHVPVTVRP